LEAEERERGSGRRRESRRMMRKVFSLFLTLRVTRSEILIDICIGARATKTPLEEVKNTLSLAGLEEEHDT
jgi:hypothetical protein